MTDELFDQHRIKAMQAFALYIAMVVRNGMEDFHHKHLSDKQMKELNPIIRNAIYTAIYAREACQKSDKAKDYVEYQVSMIPQYWENPELLPGFKLGT